MSTPMQRWKHLDEAKANGHEIAWMPPALPSKHSWIDVKDHPVPKSYWYVTCCVTKDFEWYGELLWNRGKWEIPREHPFPKPIQSDFLMWPQGSSIGQIDVPFQEFKFSDITHFHYFGLEGETQEQQVVLVPLEKIKERIDKK